MAIDFETKKEQFLKIYKKRYLIDEKITKLVNNEVLVLQKLGNKNNILEYHSQSQDDRQFYIFFEANIGGDFFVMMREIGGFEQNVAQMWCINLIKTLATVHKARIIYRSLTPENLNYGQNGQLSLMNFEFSKLLDAKSKDRLTQTVCGTPEYSPPELFTKKGQSYSIDMWQLGCLIQEIILGESPFKSDDPIDLYEKILYKSPNQTLESPACDVVQKLLEKNKETRESQFKEGMLDILKEPWFNSEKDNFEKIQGAQMNINFKPKIIKSELNLQVDYDDSLLLSDEVELEENSLFDVESQLRNVQ